MYVVTARDNSHGFRLWARVYPQSAIDKGVELLREATTSEEVNKYLPDSPTLRNFNEACAIYVDESSEFYDDLVPPTDIFIYDTSTSDEWQGTLVGGTGFLSVMWDEEDNPDFIEGEN